jgi:hypothetical protein
LHQCEQHKQVLQSQEHILAKLARPPAKDGGRAFDNAANRQLHMISFSILTHA